jgi:tRNA uridine 5-carboxymethylaminomethyl modification enzyme
MFTSRAEYRLLLRVDNADLRLTPKGREIGLVGDERWESFCSRKTRFEGNLRRLRTSRVEESNGARIPVDHWLRQPATRLSELMANGFELETPLSRLDIPSVETTLKYQGYLKRQESEINRRSREENRRIPAQFCYAGVPGLSAEVVQRLTQVRPETIGQAMRVPGITPAAVAVLSTYVSRSREI